METEPKDDWRVCPQCHGRKVTRVSHSWENEGRFYNETCGFCNGKGTVPVDKKAYWEE